MRISAVILFVLIITGCRQVVQDIPPDLNNERNRRKEALLKLNRYVVMRNQDLVTRFVDRTGWKMNKTLTGLWYVIYSQGTGNQVSENDVVHYAYTSFRLDGTFIDSASVTAPKKIRIGRGEIERGLEEIFPMMKEGGRARVIIPPHLAYVSLQDVNTDEQGSIILYDLHLLKVTK